MNNVELARAGFEAFNRGDVDFISQFLHPEIEVHNAEEVGQAGTYHGRDGYGEWIRDWMDAWEEFRIEIEEVEEVDDQNVLVHCDQHARGQGSGVEVTRRVVFLLTLQDGLAKRLHIYGDRESALAALERERSD
jgi:ketosteroid isomerase-like protein